MANIRSNGTKIYALVEGVIVAFMCYNAIDLGADTVNRIDISCLDQNFKKYMKGSRDPGEGSLTVQLDDENATHAQLLEIADDGENLEWFLGSDASDDAPTVTGGVVTLPTTRNWLTFEGYISSVAPTIETDGVWTYAWPLTRTSPVTTVLRTITP